MRKFYAPSEGPARECLVPVLLIPIPPQPVIHCAVCGADLNGRVHLDTAGGPVCAVPCEPREFQLTVVW